MDRQVPNLDAVQDLKFKRANLTKLTKDAVFGKDALSLSTVAAMWDEIGEAWTAEKCRELSQGIIGLDMLKELVEKSSKRDKFIIPTD